LPVEQSVLQFPYLFMNYT